MASPDSNQLCLECGLCCNGVIFADGQLQPDDNALRLRALGLSLKRRATSGDVKFHQPCAAFQNRCCTIYSERPRYCREFDCLLLKSVQEGETEFSEAQKVTRKARRRAEKVKRLLRDLGDQDEHVALSLRFRRMQKRFERESSTAEEAHLYGELTLAVHDLHVLIGESFYPG